MTDTVLEINTDFNGALGILEKKKLAEVKLKTIENPQAVILVDPDNLGGDPLMTIPSGQVQKFAEAVKNSGQNDASKLSVRIKTAAGCYTDSNPQACDVITSHKINLAFSHIPH